MLIPASVSPKMRRFALFLTLGICPLAMASTPMPREEVVVDWSRSDPGVQGNPASSDPETINTCMDPVSIEVDMSGFTAGTAVSTLTGFDDAGACWVGGHHIENFTMYAYVPFTVTCGSGSKFRGHWVKDLGNRDVSDEGGCGQSRDANWQTPGAYLQQSATEPKLYTVRNMNFNFDNGTREVIRYLDLRELESSSAIKNHTFPLLPWAGGDRVLGRPVLFVHGLNEYYTEAWGVVPQYRCTVGPVSPVASGSSSVTLSTSTRRSTYRTQISGGLEFTGACQEDGTSRNWATPSTQLSNTSLAPSFADATVRTAWESDWNANPPMLSSWRLDGNDLVVDYVDWVMVEDLTRDLTGMSRKILGEVAGSRKSYAGTGLTSVVMTRANIEMRIASVATNWYHQSYVPQRAGILAQVSQYAQIPYLSATAPDMISRYQRLKMGTDINRNGIYFFNGFRTLNSRLVQPHPWWTKAGPNFPGQPGESWTLYQALEQVLQLHYSDAWKTDPSLQVDLVAHSRGGVTIREMVANAGGQDPNGNTMPTGTANPVNHIRTVVTSNTPHFGSVFSTSWQSMPGEYANSQQKLVKDSAKFDETLFDATIDPTFLAAMGAGYLEGPQATSSTAGWFLNQQPDGGTAMLLLSPIWLPITMAIDLPNTVQRLPADIRIRLTGNWFWPKSMLATWEYPWGSEKITREKVDLDYAHSITFNSRREASHLAIDSEDINRLAATYPILPNGTPLDLQPLSSTIPGMGKLIGNLLANNLSGLCDLSTDLRNAECYGGWDALRFDGLSFTHLIDRVDADLPLGGFLNDYAKGWMARSDIAVQEESQKATKIGTTWNPQLHPGAFHESRPYAIRRFLTGGRFPDSLVPHGSLSYSFDTTLLTKRFSGNAELVGAGWLGHDIYCALAPDCRDLLQAATGKVIRFPWDEATATTMPILNVAARKVTTSISGNFTFGLMTADTGYTVVEVAAPTASTPSLRMVWSPSVGVQITDAGGATKVLIPPGYVGSPRIQRTGNQLIVTAVTWAGRTYSSTVNATSLPQVLNFTVFRKPENADKVYLVGTGSVDSKYENPRSETQVQVWFREARGTQTTLSKPLMILENTGTKAINGVQMRYRFLADPLRQVVLDAPSSHWRIEHLGGDLCELVFDDPTANVQPGGSWPTASDLNVAMHFADWTPWDVFKDPSNDRNIGYARVNETIRAWDGSGRLIWGREVGRTDVERPIVERITVATRDAGASEPNTTKPEIQVRNDGNAPLQNLELRWYIRVPTGFVPSLDSWYVPKSTIDLNDFGNGLWAIRIVLHEWIQPGQTVSVGSFGVHLSNWTPWDKRNDPSHQGPDGQWSVNPWVEVRTSAGDLIWGSQRDLGTIVPPPPPPTDSVNGLAVQTHAESNEANIVKPRVVVRNNGTSVVHGFRLVFPVVPERNLVPVLEPYYVPGCQTRVETSGSNTQGVVECRNLQLTPGSVWPDEVGAVFGMHYGDWSPWNSSDDPAFTGMGASFAPATGVLIQPYQAP